MDTNDYFFIGDLSGLDLTDSEELLTESPAEPPKKASTLASAINKTTQAIVPQQTQPSITSTTSSDPNKIYTVKQAADYLHLHTDTILKKIKSGEIGAFWVGRFWRIKQSQIDDYLNNNISKYK